MSSSVRATVLVPTHDHGPLLRVSLASALAQTVEEIEVFVVGDGAPDETRVLVVEIAEADERVRFFDNPKGPRHGELHRHAALREARGEAVLYLSDDDIWLSDHAATMLAALERLDLVGATCLKVRPEDDAFAIRIHDLGRPANREALMAGSGIPLSCAGHTLAAYRALPFGWRTTPSDVATDKYMWQQFLADPACTVGSTRRATVLTFGSPLRRHMTAGERLAELERWWRRVEDPRQLLELYAAVAEQAVDGMEHFRATRRQEREKIARLRSQSGGLAEAVNRLRRLAGRLRAGARRRRR